MTMAQQNFTCTRCNNSIIIASGQYTCNTCGLVHGPKYVPAVDSWNDHEVGESLLHTNGSTFNPAPHNPLFQRLKKRSFYYKHSESYHIIYFRLLHRICDALRINLTIRLRASQLFKEIDALDVSSILGYRVQHINKLSVALILATREAGPNASIRISEIFGAFEIFVRLNRKATYKILQMLPPKYKALFRPKPAVEFVPRLLTIAIQLIQEDLLKKNIDPSSYKQSLHKLSTQILQQFKSIRHSLSPYNKALAAIYYGERVLCKTKEYLPGKRASRQFLNQSEFAKACGTCAYSLWLHKQHLIPILTKIEEEFNEQC